MQCIQYPSQLKILIFCGLCLLAACSKTVDGPLYVHQQLASPYTKSASVYLALANQQLDPYERDAFLIMAAGRLIDDGQWQQGRTILSRLNQLSPRLASEKQLLRAKIEIIRSQSRSAIAQLAKIRGMNELPLYYQAQYHEMLACAYQSTGNPVESVAERMKLNALLPDEASKADNLRALWLALTTLPVAELNTMALESEAPSELKGWVHLALISRNHDIQPQVMKEKLKQWQSLYAKHPGNHLLKINQADLKLFSPPKQIALLLPLTGKFAGPGNAVRDGFMAAYSESGQADEVNVRFYNTAVGQVSSLYSQALSDGADYIVGPLAKRDAEIVAAMDHPVPTLLLNDLNKPVAGAVYQFGLSPSGEAMQVAFKARKSGHTRALVIAPQGNWGNEVIAAFDKQWRLNGGQVSDVLRFKAGDDLNSEISRFLHVSESEARSKQLKQLLGRHIQSTPRRRQDFDMIFLLAYPSHARQIMPLLRYYYTGDTPVYATSTTYAGVSNPRKDRDLNGIIFCDMPWVFTHQESNKNWPEQWNSYNRLYALGMDSYALSRQLNQLLLFPAMGISDQSGVLSLNPNQKIDRILIWAQFKDGLAKNISVIS